MDRAVLPADFHVDVSLAVIDLQCSSIDLKRNRCKSHILGIVWASLFYRPQLISPVMWGNCPTSCGAGRIEKAYWLTGQLGGGQVSYAHLRALFDKWRESMTPIMTSRIADVGHLTSIIAACKLHHAESVITTMNPYVTASARAHTHAHKQIRTHTNTHTHKHARTQTSTHAHKQTRTHTNTHTHKHARTNMSYVCLYT